MLNNKLYQPKQLHLILSSCLLSLLLYTNGALPEVLAVTPSSITACKASLPNDMSADKKERVCEARLKRSLAQERNSDDCFSPAPGNACNGVDSTGYTSSAHVAAISPPGVITRRNLSSIYAAGFTANNGLYRTKTGTNDGKLYIHKKVSGQWQQLCKINDFSNVECEDQSNSGGKTITQKYRPQLDGFEIETVTLTPHCNQYSYVLSLRYCSSVFYNSNTNTDRYIWD